MPYAYWSPENANGRSPATYQGSVGQQGVADPSTISGYRPSTKVVSASPSTKPFALRPPCQVAGVSYSG